MRQDRPDLSVNHLTRNDSMGNLSGRIEQIQWVIVRFLNFASEVKNLSLAQLSFPIALITNMKVPKNKSSQIKAYCYKLPLYCQPLFKDQYCFT